MGEKHEGIHSGITEEDRKRAESFLARYKIDEEKRIKYEWMPDWHIDINKELDLSRLTVNKDEYSIMVGNWEGNPFAEKFILTDKLLKDFSKTTKRLVVDTQESCVNIYGLERYDSGSGANLRYSIDKIYRGFFRFADTLNTKDLLGNIVILYAIKRAQNGEEEAITKLCSLYEKKAIKTAKEFIEARRPQASLENKCCGLQGGLLGTKKSKEQKGYTTLTPPNIEEVAKDILRLLISGDRPENILTLLKYSGLDKLQFINTRKLDKLFTIYGKIVLPNFIETFKKKLTKLVEDYKKSNSQAEKQGIEKTISTFTEASLMFMLPHSWMMGDPHIGKMRFNPDVFRPSRAKKGNLTTWLFGTEENLKKWCYGRQSRIPQQMIYTRPNGRFCQRLADWFKNQQVQNEIKTDSLDNEIDTGEDKISLHDIKDKRNPTAGDILEKIDKSEAIKRIKDIIKKKNISQRDIEILYLSIEKMPCKNIAIAIHNKDLHPSILSNKQIGRIITSTATVLRKELSKTITP